MKVLLVAGASPATLFGMTPLAGALRNARHEVILASTEEMVPVGEKLGVPFVSATDRSIESLLHADRTGAPVPRPVSLPDQLRFGGNWFGRLAAASLERLLELSKVWRPDLVIGGTCSYVAALLAVHLDIPQVRLAWDALDYTESHPYADEELGPELAALGLVHLPEPDLFLDICPPSVRSPLAPPATSMRWVPGNLQQRLEPWMLARGDRPRVLVTSGSRVAMTGSQSFLQTLAENVAASGAEVLVAAPEEAAPELRAQLPGLQVGWLPLDVLAPSCDVIVHHGGGVTGVTAMSAGVPQLALPQLQIFGDSWVRLAEFGAAITLVDDEQSAGNVSEGVAELLAEGSYRERSQALAREMAAMPGPADQVGGLEKLAAS